MNTEPVLTALLLALLTGTTPAVPSTPLPTDLQLVPSDVLPVHATWFSLQRWGTRPPTPVNPCAGRTDVLYYRSPSFGTNKIIIDDTLIDDTALATMSPMTASSGPPMPGDGGGGSGDAGIPGPLNPPFGSNDLWLEVQFDTNAPSQVDVILHGATNGVWQLLSTTNLAGTNLTWTVVEIQIDDGTTNNLYFGPYPDDDPPINFFRAQLATNLFLVVATNLPGPVGIDYHSARRSLVLSINYNNNDPTFGILDTNAFLTNWSDLSFIDEGYEVRIATVKTSTNGFNAGELFFSSGMPSLTPATIGWVSADGSTAMTNWVTLTNDPNQVEALFVDETGLWGNDLLAISGADDPQHLQSTNLNVWRIHSRTNSQLVASIPALHLEGLLTLPNDTRYGPWAGKLLTADETQQTIYAVATNGTFTANILNIDADTFRLIPTNQDLYCVQFRGAYGLESSLLKIPREFFRRYVNDILVLQAGEFAPDHPILFILHWNGSTFEVDSIDLWHYFPNDGFFEKAAFAPISMPAVQ